MLTRQDTPAHYNAVCCLRMLPGLHKEMLLVGSIWSVIKISKFIEIFVFFREKIRTRKRLKLHRLYFVWVCKHVQSFQWFVDLLRSTFTEVSIFRCHNYIILFMLCNLGAVKPTGRLSDEKVAAIEPACILRYWELITCWQWSVSPLSLESHLSAFWLHISLKTCLVLPNGLR